MRIANKLTLTAVIFNIVMVFTAAAFASADPVGDELIRERINALKTEGGLSIGSATVRAETIVATVYKERGYRRAWERQTAFTELVTTIENAAADGLDPGDYHYKHLQAYQKLLQRDGAASPREAAEVDILATDSLVCLAYHLYFGKVDPQGLSPYLNLVRTIDTTNLVQQIQQALDSHSPKRFIDGLIPRHPFYLRLKKVLAQYRAIQKAGGWQAIAYGGQLAKGDRDDRILQVRQHLRLTGDLKDHGLASNLFDEHLEGAVIRFQVRQSLEPDGIINRNTLAELNVPVQERIDQIRANLERARWVLHDIPDTFLIIDIAGYSVRFVREGEIIWSARTQVGKPFRQTPVFASEIRLMVLNPTWTVPPGIFRKDILPEVKKDPAHLDQLDIRIYTPDNRIISAAAIDWSAYPAKRFPYILRQGPGPTNPLGDIKFLLPNPFYIYLHDTPDKEEFDSSWRALSAGCIRVEYPLELAELLLNDPERWNTENLRQQINSGRTVTLRPAAPMPALFLYLTVWVNEAGAVYFREDVYQRDDKILQALTGDFEIRLGSPSLNPVL